MSQTLTRVDSIDYLLCNGKDTRRNRQAERLGGLNKRREDLIGIVYGPI